MNEVPIRDLPLFDGARRNIRGVVVEKDDQLRRAFNKEAVFNFSVQDRWEETVSVVAFDDVARDIFDFIQIGSTYEFKNVALWAIDDLFNTTTFNFQLLIRDRTEIRRCGEDEALEMPERRVLIRPISLAQAVQLANLSLCDILGVITDVSEPQQVFSTRHQCQYELRELTLADATETRVKLTVWEDKAGSFDERAVGSVLSAKNCLWKRYNNRAYFTLFWSGSFEKAPRTQEAADLLAWFNAR